MNARKISRDMAIEVLAKGRLLRQPEPNLRRGSTECTMERYIAGRDIGVVAAVTEDNARVVIVTTMLIGG